MQPLLAGPLLAWYIAGRLSSRGRGWKPTSETTHAPRLERLTRCLSYRSSPRGAEEQPEKEPMTESVQEPTQESSTGAFAATMSEDFSVSIRKLIDAGVHFGHQTNRWNPKMAPYIYGARNGIHIVDLDQTARFLKRALNFASNAVGRGGQILFVGTKRQAQDVIIEEV